MPLKQFSEEEINYMKQKAEEGECLTSIAIYLKSDRGTIKRALERYNIQLNPSLKNNQGKKDLWTSHKLNKLKEYYKSNKVTLDWIAEELGISKGSIVRKARELGIKKTPVEYRKDSLNDIDIQFIKENIEEMTLDELAIKLDCCVETISKKLNELNIFVRRGNGFRPPNNEEFDNDICNPGLTNTELGRKYNISPCVIGRIRKERFPEFKYMINTYLHKSTYEVDFENNILEPLNLTFEYQKKIDKWRVDYYIGLNIVVEIQGEFWHDSTKNKERDQRKYNELTNLGYQVIHIYSKDIYSESEKTKELFKQIYTNAVLSQFTTEETRLLEQN